MLQLQEKPVLKWIEQRIKRNKNCIIVINGPTGDGKSYSAIPLANQVAELLGTNFSISKNVAFKFKQMLNMMKLPENDQPGTPFVFEEVGAFGGGASSREWQSKANKFFFSFMQTARHKNQIIIMNCPNFSFLEKGCRSLVHMQIQTAGIDFIHKKAFLKPYRVQVNVRTGKFYFKYLRVRIKGRKIKLKTIMMDHPPQKMADEYEKVKSKFTSELNEQILNKDKEKNEKPEWKCNICKHSWNSRVKVPSYCPRCQKRDIYEGKRTLST